MQRLHKSPFTLDTFSYRWKPGSDWEASLLLVVIIMIIIHFHFHLRVILVVGMNLFGSPYDGILSITMNAIDVHSIHCNILSGSYYGMHSISK